MRRCHEILRHIILLLVPPINTEVLLLQAWPEPAQECDYSAAALATAAKSYTQHNQLPRHSAGKIHLCD